MSPKPTCGSLLASVYKVPVESLALQVYHYRSDPSVGRDPLSLKILEMFIDMRPQTDINIGQKGRSVLRRRIKRWFLGENLVGSTPKIPFPLSLDYPAGTRTDDYPQTAEANGRPKYNSNKLYISDLISPRNLSFKSHNSSLIYAAAAAITTSRLISAAISTTKFDRGGMGDRRLKTGEGFA
ncbi:hypothetical protein Godav_023145 [Gossypium davidsonii]|uniref:Uncharacterized protein n=1 Tax=Gossypium davidsonii TaxID=34287 RepID=A0A7J8SRI6_GOSDV|nr:hypothetical protein [Gossypium davidsonii]